MSEKIILGHANINIAAMTLAQKLGESFHGTFNAYPIPRGGIPAAYAVSRHLPGMRIVDNPEDAHVFIDDIVDSGSTRARYFNEYHNPNFFALFDKTKDTKLGWIVFPWEVSEDRQDEGIEDNIVRILQYVGEDPHRGGLLETPRRVAKAYKEWTSGYGVEPKSVLKCFEDGGEGYNEMVIQRNLPFYSLCEHHMAPFFGTATIAYIPNGKIVGLSKLSRLLDIFARRLQTQERITTQVADALMEHLDAKGAGVSLTARHLCMESRGVHKQGHDTRTNALRGVMYDDARTRSEFMESLR